MTICPSLLFGIEFDIFELKKIKYMNSKNFYQTAISSLFEGKCSGDNLFNKFLESIDDSCRIEKKESGWELRLALPGVTKNETEIKVDGNNLIVNIDSKNGWVKKSQKAFILPRSANHESIFAEMKDGILSISISTKNDQKSKNIKIN